MWSVAIQISRDKFFAWGKSLIPTRFFWGEVYQYGRRFIVLVHQFAIFTFPILQFAFPTKFGRSFVFNFSRKIISPRKLKRILKQNIVGKHSALWATWKSQIRPPRRYVQTIYSRIYEHNQDKCYMFDHFSTRSPWSLVRWSSEYTVGVMILGSLRNKEGDGYKNVTKTWVRAASNLIALIPSRSIHQILENFSRVEFWKAALKFRKRKSEMWNVK